MKKTTKSRATAGTLAVGLMLAAMFAQTPAGAQSGVYDPTGAPLAGAAAGAPTAGGVPTGGVAATTGAVQPTAPAAPYGPVQIQTPLQPALPEDATVPVQRPGMATGAEPQPLYARSTTEPGQFELFTRPPPKPGEFEAFVIKTIGRPLRRFGASLILDGARGFATPPTTTVPPDYRINPGDELLIGVTGSVEANLRLVVDSEGRVFIPKVGPLSVAGLRYGDLQAAVARQFNEQFRQARVTVVIGRLHGITVYVTGYAVSPGAYTVTSLSTLVDAVLAAGGPSSGGSFRSVQLRRDGRLIDSLDLYDLLLRGDKSHDQVLQNGDVINIAPVGPEIAITGSVNAEAIYEAKAGDTLADLIADAGGPNSLADTTRLVLVRLGDLDRNGSRQLTFAQAQRFPAEGGDIVRVLSLANIARPLERQAVLATIEGEVDRPGRYYLAPGASLSDLLAAAGGMTSGAFVFGTELDRETVRRQQQASFERALDDLRFQAAAAPLQALNSADRAGLTEARQTALLRVINLLADRKPDGRLVLDIPYGAAVLPTALRLEDNDHIYIPPVPKSVGVFGAVFQPGSFIFEPGLRLGDYLNRAGGPQRVAGKGDIFVVRANGAVVSARQKHDFDKQPALPGDVVFVPVRTSPSFWDRLRSISEVVFQFGLSAAALAVLANQ